MSYLDSSSSRDSKRLLPCVLDDWAYMVDFVSYLFLGFLIH